jgi:hypothetical protein
MARQRELGVGMLDAVGVSAPSAGSDAKTSNPLARKYAAQPAPITPVPTTPILPDADFTSIAELRLELNSSIWPRFPPCERRYLRLAGWPIDS